MAIGLSLLALLLGLRLKLRIVMYILLFHRLREFRSRVLAKIEARFLWEQSRKREFLFREFLGSRFLPLYLISLLIFNRFLLCASS